MSGELSIKLEDTGLTVKALITGHDRGERWNGSDMVAFDTIADADWTTGLVTCTEQETSDGTATGTYVGDFPAGISGAGEYAVEFYSGASPSPGDAHVGTQSVQWHGSATTSWGEIIGYVDCLPDVTLTAAERNGIANAVLSRDVDNVEASASEHTLCTMVLACLESSISGSTWTIKRTDGSTHATKTVTSDADADPITGVT